MSRKTRKTGILAKLETIYGADAVPAGTTDAILIINPKFTPLKQELVNRDLVRPFLGNSEQLPGAQWGIFEFETEVAGSGAAGTAPAWGVLMKGCGMGETISTGVSAAYAPISASEGSLSLYGNRDGVKYTILGARGSFSLDLVSRQRPTLKWQFTGLYVPVADAAMPAETLTSWQRPLPVNNTNTTDFALHTYAATMQSLSLNMNVKIDYANLVGTEDVQITDRAPSGTISMEEPLIATKDFYAIAKNATLGALSITHGTVAGNKFKIDAANVQLTEPTPVDVQGRAFIQMGLTLIPGSSGNDEITITSL